MALKFQRTWPPVRRESIEEIESEAAAYRQIAKRSKGSLVKIAGLESKKRKSLKDELRKDLDDAFTDEDKMEVVNKYIRRLMHGAQGYGGQSQEKATEMVFRMLQELNEE